MTPYPALSEADILEKVGQSVQRALEEQEERLDEQIERYNNLKDDDLELLRERRLAKMKEMRKKRDTFTQAGHGTLTMLTDQKDFFKAAKDSKYMVAHFYRDSARRCLVMDKHLEALAGKHFSTRFVKVNAEKSQFLCDRLKIWCIPTVMLIKEGKTEHSIVGLDELGGDDYTTEDLEASLGKWGVIEDYQP